MVSRPENLSPRLPPLGALLLRTMAAYTFGIALLAFFHKHFLTLSLCNYRLLTAGGGIHIATTSRRRFFFFLDLVTKVQM